MKPIDVTLHYCPTLDDYRKVFKHYADKGYTFAANPEPIAKVNYIKQEGSFFTRISEQEYNQLNNGSDEQI